MPIIQRLVPMAQAAEAAEAVAALDERRALGKIALVVREEFR